MLPKTFYLKTQVAFWAGTGPLVASAESLVAVVALAWTGGLNLRSQLGTDYRGPVHGPSHSSGSIEGERGIEADERCEPW